MVAFATIAFIAKHVYLPIQAEAHWRWLNGSEHITIDIEAERCIDGVLADAA